VPINQHVLGPSTDPSSHGPSLHKVKQELKKAEIIPTVIDEFRPTFFLEAEWASDVYASLGNTLKVDGVQDQPTFSLHRDASSSAGRLVSNMTYAITLTDPDAPSRSHPEWAEICHFIATGLTRSSSASDDDDPSSAVLSDLRSIMPYKPPGPPPKTGKHRYVFLLFAPANGTSDPLHLTKPEDRQHWGTGKEGHGVRDWASKNGLEPVAANFIMAQNEEQ